MKIRFRIAIQRLFSYLPILFLAWMAALPARAENASFDVATGILRIPILDIPGLDSYYIEFLHTNGLVFELTTANVITPAEALVGTWKVTPGAAPDGGTEIYFIFNQDGQFVYIEGDGELPNGAEGGTYVFDQTTGQINFSRTYDHIIPDGGLFENSNPNSAVVGAALTSGQLNLTLGTQVIAFQRL